ncbi:glycosyltransferase [Bariatricus sp. SGI.154]|uniref:glycosyltransferase n=1 Tax=Bariatricus sp. SGI.154 TaxID=3420549 RepID=UPI003CFFC346
MKIAMMTNNYKPFVGGVPISVERLSEGLRRRGHEVCIFAPEYDEAETELWEHDVVRYRSYEKRLKNGMVVPNIFDPRIREEFEWQDFDLIHVHQPMLIGNVAMHLSRKYKIPLVYTYHTRYEEYLHYLVKSSKKNDQEVTHRYWEQGKKLLPHYMAAYMKQCDLIFAPSTGMQDYLEEQKIQVPVKVLPTGIADNAYEEDTKRSGEIRSRYLRGRRSLLCTVSRLDKEKNLYFMLRCIRKLKDRLGNDFCMMLIGDGAERQGLECYAKELGIADAVVFAGQVPNQEVKDYLFASDVFLFTSKSETQGIVLAEAMAARLPVVAVSACGVNDIVRDGENGYLAREAEEEFATRVESMLRNAEEMERLRSGAAKTAGDYRMDSIAFQAERCYRMALEREWRNEAYGEETYEKKHVVSSFLRLFKAS